MKHFVAFFALGAICLFAPSCFRNSDCEKSGQVLAPSDGGYVSSSVGPNDTFGPTQSRQDCASICGPETDDGQTLHYSDCAYQTGGGYGKVRCTTYTCPSAKRGPF